MLKLLAAASIIAIATPAVAQDAAPMGSTDSQVSETELPASEAPTEEAAPMDQAETAPEAEAAPAAESAPAAEPAPESGPTNSAAAVQALVEKEFATFDADSSGDLNQDEFGAWMMQLREKQNEAQGTTAAAGSPEEMKSWAEQAFAAADSDKNAKVTKEEIAGFLVG